jgi:hypothetical protein
MEVGLKTSCLPNENIFNLQTEELVAIHSSVEQGGEDVIYVNGTKY